TAERLGSTSSPQPAALRSRCREIHRHVLLDGEAVEHAFERELAPDAALLDATIRVAGRLAEALVDLHPPGFERVRSPERTADVLCPNVAGEPVVRLVGHADGFLLVRPFDGHEHGA